MKRYLHLALALIIVLLPFAAVNAQQNPFKAKEKAKLTGTPPLPGPMTATPYSAFTSRQAPGQMLAGPPAQVNLASLTLNKLGMAQQKFNDNGQLIFLEGSVPGAINLISSGRESLESACYQYLEAIKPALGIREPAQEFKVKTATTDELGMDHVKMQQVHQGVPVWCAEVVLHSRNNVIDLFNGNYYPTPDVSTVPTVTREAAVSIATAQIASQTHFRALSVEEKELLGYEQPQASLVIYHKDRNPLQPRLAWHVAIRPNFAQEWYCFVDAADGSVIHFYNNTRHDGDVTASGTDLNGVSRNFHAYLENGVYYLVDASRPMFNPQTFDGVLSVFDAQFTNPANSNFSAGLVSSNNNTWAPGPVSAMYNASMAYEYFRTVHGRNSFNNQGGAIKSIVNVGGENGGGFDNAFWNGVAVFYGTGDVAFKPLAGALDVGAHEIGHAYEGSASNLEYQYQSGAIAESYADYAGAAVERQNWLIGEQIVKPSSFPSGCLRDMSDPHNGGNSLNDPGYQPAHLSEMYTGSEDNGGVHINSGIGNLAFYQAAQAIGLEKTEKIFWRASFNYLTRSTQFIDFRLNTIQSAKDLYGNGSNEANAIAAAFDYVGITDGQGGNYQTQLPINPGPDYILLYDLIESDPYTLYISSTSGSDFLPISQTIPINKPSVVDDGSYALFVSDDNNLRYIELDESPDESIIQQDGIWQNVAVAKDGSRVSAITAYQDSAIWVYSYDLQQWAKFHLYNATTAQGQATHTVVYADAMEWDYSGEYIIYDALTRVENQFGEPIESWDINFIKVWDNASGYWGSGEILKVFGGLPAGLSVGNPSFAKNSPYIFAFDIYEPASNTITVAAANFENGNVGEIFVNEGVLGTPNYSKMDDYMIFTVPDDLDAIAVIQMQQDRITPVPETAQYLITEAMWGIWFAQGERGLDVPEVRTDTRVFAYPNPTSGMVRLTLMPEPEGDATIKVFDVRGILVNTIHSGEAGEHVIDLAGLPQGMYFLQIQSDGMLFHEKIMIR